jgi:cephalosporin-C deacetylase
MPRFDLGPAELRAYLPSVAEPDDFDDFWQRTLSEHMPDTPPHIAQAPTELALVDAFDVTFAGFGGHPVKAWLLLPHESPGPLPGIVEYVGYNGGRGMAHERLAWVAAGYAYLVMDTRGQGSGSATAGDTADPVGSGPAAPGFITRGIASRETYYFRRVFTDGVRAAELLRSLPQVDASKVSVTGRSQGGAIAIAVAGLMEGLLAALPDVPFLCDISRAVGLTDGHSYGEIVQYLSVHRESDQQVFQVLSYFDGVNFAKRASIPALFSAAHMDTTCPPSTVFAAYNHWGGPDTEIIEYPFNGHEGGGPLQWQRQARWLRTRVSTSG